MTEYSYNILLNFKIFKTTFLDSLLIQGFEMSKESIAGQIILSATLIKFIFEFNFKSICINDIIGQINLLMLM